MDYYPFPGGGGVAINTPCSDDSVAHTTLYSLLSDPVVGMFNQGICRSPDNSKFAPSPSPKVTV